MRGRLPYSLARHIDKLAQRAHAFHRYAHHPLCTRYEGEVLRVGRRWRLCRGCTFTLSALSLGALLGASVAASRVWLMAALVLAAVLAAQSVLAPQLLRKRLGKLGTRALPALAGAFCVSSSVLHARAWDIAGVALLGASVLFVLYRRRGPDRTPCTSCPEYQGPVTCSGFVEIVRAERAFQRRSLQLIARDQRGRADVAPSFEGREPPA